MQSPAAPARHINFVIAYLGYWLFPGRLGPHLGKGTFFSAIVAAIMGLATSTVIVCTLPLWSRSDWYESILTLRETAAGLVLNLSIASSTSNWSWPTVAGILAIPLEILIAFVILGVLLSPWAADGDSLKSAMGRSVKIALWSVTVLPVFGLSWAACWWVLSNFPLTGMEPPSDSFPFALYGSRSNGASDFTLGLSDTGKLLCNGFLPVLFVLIYLYLYFKGAARYAGPSIGPGFEVREPRCRSCGYVLFGLKVTSRCAECGKLVSDSYRQVEASLPPWNPELHAVSFMREFFQMQCRCMSDAGLLAEIPVNGHWAVARRFWWTTCVCFGACLALMYATANYAMGRTIPEVKDVHLLGAAILTPIVVHVGAIFVACLWARVRHGIRDPRISVICVCYAAPMFWTWVLLLAISIDVLSFVHPSTVLVSDYFYELNLQEMVIGVLIVGLATTFLIWRRRVDLALASARFASF